MYESAADDPRLRIAVDPAVVYGLNQQFVFGNILSKAWLETAFMQLERAGVANDIGSLEVAASEAGLRLTEEEAGRVEKLRLMVEAHRAKAPMALEQIALEDGIGVPAVAIMVVVVLVAVSVWVSVSFY